MTAVIDHLELDDVVLVGHSLGSPVALEAGVLLQERTRAVVPVDAWGELAFKPSTESQQQFLGLFEPDYESGVRSWVSSGMFLPQSDSSLIDRIASDMALTPAGIGLATFGGVYAWRRARTPDAFVEYGGAQFFVNAEGTAFDPTQRELYGRAFPLSQIPRVGHFPMLEAPDEFNAILDDVLAQLR